MKPGRTLFSCAAHQDARAAQFKAEDLGEAPIAGEISPWQPERDPIRLAVLGKLIEECSELAGRAARCIIQGGAERDPKTGRTNLEELAREAADVIACIETAESKLGMAVDSGRVGEKFDGFRHWHGMIEPAPEGWA